MVCRRFYHTYSSWWYRYSLKGMPRFIPRLTFNTSKQLLLVCELTNCCFSTITSLYFILPSIHPSTFSSGLTYPLPAWPTHLLLHFSPHPLICSSTHPLSHPLHRLILLFIDFTHSLPCLNGVTSLLFHHLLLLLIHFIPNDSSRDRIVMQAQLTKPFNVLMITLISCLFVCWVIQ